MTQTPNYKSCYGCLSLKDDDTYCIQHNVDKNPCPCRNCLTKSMCIDPCILFYDWSWV